MDRDGSMPSCQPRRKSPGQSQRPNHVQLADKLPPDPRPSYACRVERSSATTVAERAGVSIGSLYHYFPRKEGGADRRIVRTRDILADRRRGGSYSRTVRSRGPFGADPRGHIAPVPPLQTWRTCSTSRRARLAFDVDTRQVSERFRAVLSTVLLLPDLPGQADGGAAARDVMAIKGMVDAAGAWRDGSVRAHNKGAQRSA
jgi:AcrR family transcriptional regulator